MFSGDSVVKSCELNMWVLKCSENSIWAHETSIDFPRKFPMFDHYSTICWCTTNRTKLVMHSSSISVYPYHTLFPHYFVISAHKKVVNHHQTYRSLVIHPMNSHDIPRKQCVNLHDFPSRFHQNHISATVSSHHFGFKFSSLHR